MRKSLFFHKIKNLDINLMIDLIKIKFGSDISNKMSNYCINRVLDVLLLSGSMKCTLVVEKHRFN